MKCNYKLKQNKAQNSLVVQQVKYPVLSLQQPGHLVQSLVEELPHAMGKVKKKKKERKKKRKHCAHQYADKFLKSLREVFPPKKKNLMAF